MPDVFDDTIVPARRTDSTRASSARFASSCSMTASRIQSTFASFARSVSKPPVVMKSVADSAVKNGSGFKPRARLSPSRAVSAVTSSNNTGMPALAKCAAICAPIVPAPRTATLRKVDITHMLQCAASPKICMEGRMVRWLAIACLVLACAVSARAQTGASVWHGGRRIWRGRSPALPFSLPAARTSDFATSGPGGANVISQVAVGSYEPTATLVGIAPAAGDRVVVGPNVSPVMAPPLTLKLATLVGNRSSRVGNQDQHVSCGRARDNECADEYRD